ncbi:Pmp3 protein [Saccharomycopsis crataegensis]|uniref:Pmp3 protein n=1 Tax=Saccharomycopsis crataegensis TaxID=43959 RepID=A0AAV5QMA1_9ASCO|nr:Pmp3 protein [Saccharomycopsis crataegensis]
MADSNLIIDVLIAIILPPVAVYIKEGTTSPFWINLILCLFVWFPAILHALYVVFKNRNN